MFDSYEVDLFLACFIGGFCGGASLMLILRYHFRHTYRRYQKAKEAVNEISALRRLEYEVEQLRVAIAKMNKEIYTAYEQEAD